MRLEGKRKLVVLLIGFFIALGFTILAIRKGIELISVEQDLSKSTGEPIHRVR